MDRDSPFTLSLSLSSLFRIAVVLAASNLNFGIPTCLFCLCVLVGGRTIKIKKKKKKKRTENKKDRKKKSHTFYLLYLSLAVSVVYLFFSQVKSRSLSDPSKRWLSLLLKKNFGYCPLLKETQRTIINLLNSSLFHHSTGWHEKSHRPL